MDKKTAAYFEAMSNAVKYDGKTPEGRKLYREAQQNVDKEFMLWLATEHGIEGLPEALRTKIAEAAWEAGHANGYHEVWLVMEDYAELARLAYDAGWKAALDVSMA